MRPETILQLDAHCLSVCFDALEHYLFQQHTFGANIGSPFYRLWALVQRDPGELIGCSEVRNNMKSTLRQI